MSFWWAEMDSNHRRRKSTDLQSVAFGRSAIYPSGAGGRNRTNNRLITSQMLYHWATPAWRFFGNFPKNGAAGRNRTTDTEIFSLLLYRLSYRGIPCFSKKTGKNKWRPGTGSNRRPPAWQAGALTNWATGPNYFSFVSFGGPSRTWTADQPVMSRSL